VNQAVQDRVAIRGIADLLVPSIRRYLRRQQCRAALMTVVDDLHQIAPLIGRQLGHQPVVQDQEPRWKLADAALSLELGGRSLPPVWADASSAVFAVPALGRPGLPRLRSRTRRPSDARPSPNDRRALGVQVRRLFIDGEALAVDGPALAVGWWPVEPGRGGAATRWTDGGRDSHSRGSGVLMIEVAAVGPLRPRPTPAAGWRRRR
jgi:hypothetical protein